MTLLTVTGLSVKFPGKDQPLAVLNRLNLTLASGELLALLGPSGCGKSTLVRSLAGLLKPTEVGEVTWNGQASDLGEVASHVSYMPQSNSLLPWRTVVDNVALALVARHQWRWGPARDQARSLLADFQLEDFASHYPSALSGGMAARVAFVRAAIIAQPLLLLDEPFSALDEITRESAQDWLAARWNGRTSAILVTHSIAEAVRLADRVMVLGERGQPPRLDLVIPTRRDERERDDPQAWRFQQLIRSHLH